MKVKVGPITYDLAFSTKRLQATCEHEQEYLLGRCLPFSAELLVREGQQRDVERETVLHEVIHACFFDAGLGAEEKHASRLAPRLLDTLQRNPSLRRYFFGEKN